MNKALDSSMSISGNISPSETELVLPPATTISKLGSNGARISEEICRSEPAQFP